MAVRRKTLPGDFSEVLSHGDLNDMIAVFDRCDVNATSGRYGTNALGESDVPAGLMRWLVEHGANPNLRDTYGATPLSGQIIARNLDGIRVLIELGADPEDVNSDHDSALKYAARQQRPEVVQMLLARPATRRLLSRRPVPPSPDVVEAALAGSTNAGLPATAAIVEMLVDAGSRISDRARARVTRIGEDFERVRDSFSPEALPVTDTALRRLYRLAGVEPAAPVGRHAGTRPIEIPPGSQREQFGALWQLLVPPSGAAATAQGEAIRIVGRVADELQRNGGANWDADYRAMLANLQRLLGSGTSPAAHDLADVRETVRQLRGREVHHHIDTLERQVLSWIRANPVPIPLPPPNYRR